MTFTRTFLSLGLILGIGAAPLGCGDDSSGGGGAGAAGGSDTGGNDTGGGGSVQGGGGSGAAGGSGGAGAAGGSGGSGAAGAAGGSGGAGGVGAAGGSGGAGGDGGSGGSGGSGGTGGGNPGDPDAQIAAVIAAADGPVSLPIEGALITFEKPLAGSDPHGFFLQASEPGPAIFVAVDPGTFMGDVGDEVDLTVTEVATVAGQKRATMISGPSVVSSNNDVLALVSDVNLEADLVTNLDDYTSRVVYFDAIIDTDFVGASAPHVAAQISTLGLDDMNLRLRMPESVRAAYDLESNCIVTVDYGVMWRFNSVAQPSVTDPLEIFDPVCDDPVVDNAIASANNTVVVTFSRDLDPTSVTASDFTFDNGLTAMSVMVTAPDEVTITTSAQAGGTTYTLTVDSVDDVLGVPVMAPDNTAMFSSFVTFANLRINELNANVMSQNCDLIELRVVSGGTIAGFTLTERVGNLMTLPDMMVATNDIIVVHINGGNVTCNPLAAANETMSKNQFSVGAGHTRNYDLAWDFWSTDSGLTNTDNVFQIKDAVGTIQDAILVSDDVTGTAAADSETAAAAVAAVNQWFTTGGMVPAGGYIDDAFSANAVQDLNGTSLTAAGLSIQRLNTDDNDLQDWTMVDSTFGVLNVGQ